MNFFLFRVLWGGVTRAVGAKQTRNESDGSYMPCPELTRIKTQQAASSWAPNKKVRTLAGSQDQANYEAANTKRRHQKPIAKIQIRSQ